MYQITIKNPGKLVVQGDILSFSINGFPPNTTLEYYISDQKWNIFWKDRIVSDANGSGNFAIRCGNDLKGNYRLYVRNYIYGCVNEAFTVVEENAITPVNSNNAPAITNPSAPERSAASELDNMLQEVEEQAATKAKAQANDEQARAEIGVETGAECGQPRVDAEI